MPGFTPVNAVKKPPLITRHVQMVENGGASNGSLQLQNNGGDSSTAGTPAAQVNNEPNGAQHNDNETTMTHNDDENKIINNHNTNEIAAATSKFVTPNPTQRRIQFEMTLDGSRATSSNDQEVKFHTLGLMRAQAKGRSNPPLDWSTVRKPSQVANDKERDERVFDLERVPTLRPTWDEFKDPMRFIESINDTGVKYGMVKIIPPKEWDPTFALDTDLFSFKTRRQCFNRRGPELNQRFISDLYELHQSRGTAISKQPSIDRREVDLLRMHQVVRLRGGLQEVVNKKMWAQIGRELGYSGRSMTSLSTSLKNTYQKYLIPLEESLNERKVELSNGTRLPAYHHHHHHQSSETKDEDGKVVKRARMSSHEFPQVLGSENILHRVTPYAELPNPPDDPVLPAFDDWHRGSVIDDYHTDFRRAPFYFLRQFQQKSHQYIHKYFDTESASIDEARVEKEFWRIVCDPSENVEVEYGMDLPSAVQTSAFAQIERDSLDEEATDGWNPNAIPFSKHSFCRFVGADIPHMVEPWICVGMIFACKGWNFEDYFSHSVNYHHLGETKTWYSIPQDKFDEFHNLLGKIDDESHSVLESNYMVSPEQLQARGIKVYAADQRPGEIVITFPKTYHSHLNHGFNVTESVNVLPTSSWLEYGKQCLQIYRKFKQPPPFCLQQMLMAITDKSLYIFAQQGVEEEIAARQRVRDRYPYIVVDKQPDELQECCQTRDYCFLSRVVSLDADDVLSLGAFMDLNVNDDTVHRYKLVYEKEDDELRASIAFKPKEEQEEDGDDDDRDDKDLASKWYNNLAKLITKDPKPSLSQLQNLMDQASGLDVDTEPLQQVIDRAEGWKSRAKSALADSTTLESFQQLLNEINDLAVDIAEVEQVRSRALAIQAYMQKIENLSLDAEHDYDALLREGQQLKVELPETESVSHKVAVKKWRERASESVDCTDLDLLRTLSMEGLRLNVHDTEPELWDKLSEKKQQGQRFEHDVRSKLAGDLLPKEIDEFIERAQTVPSSKELQTRLEQRKEKNVPDQQSVQDDPRPSYEDAEKMLEEAKNMSSKPNIYALEKETRVVQAWKREGKRLFGKGNAPLYILRTHLSYVKQRNDACFSLDDLYHEGEKSVQFCLCRQTDNSGMMMECDECHEWYHGRCLKYGRSKTKANNCFVCPICDFREEIPRDACRPKLEDMETWNNASIALPLRPSELDMIKHIVQVAIAFRKFLADNVINKLDIKPPELRFYLRKLEGAEILLAEEVNSIRQKLHHLAPVGDTPPPIIEESKSTRRPRAAAAASLSEDPPL